MKVWILILMMCLVCVTAQAQCVAEIKDALIDEKRGSIIVETQYKLNGNVVDIGATICPLMPNGKYEVTVCNKDGCFQKECVGRTRYIETHGTIAEIVQKAKDSIQKHCENLFLRNVINKSNLKTDKLLAQKSLTQAMVADIKTNAVGWTKTMTKYIFQYKNKEFTIEADGTYTIADIIP